MSKHRDMVAGWLANRIDRNKKAHSLALALCQIIDEKDAAIANMLAEAAKQAQPKAAPSAPSPKPPASSKATASAKPKPKPSTRSRSRKK